MRADLLLQRGSDGRSVQGRCRGGGVRRAGDGCVPVLCLSYLGHEVVCADEDEERIKGLEEGRVPFYGPGLEVLLSRYVREERLSLPSPRR